MKIPPVSTINALRAYGKTKAVPGAEKTLSVGADHVEISSEASAFGAAFRSVMQSLENGDSARVETVKKRVESGSYAVPASDIAEKLLAGTRLNIEG